MFDVLCSASLFLTVQSVPQHQRDRLLCNPLGADLHANKNKKNGSVGPVSVLSPKYGNVLKVYLRSLDWSNS